MSYIVEHLNQNIWRGKFSSFPEKDVIHGFSCRLGGVSQEPFDSLNMGLHVGDSPDAVRENRRLFLSLLRLKPSDCVTPEQVHGTEIASVDVSFQGRGMTDYQDALKATDALITDAPGLALFLCFADCVPVLFYDEEHHAIGLAHAGWKGSIKRIAKKTVESMEKKFGTNPQKLIAGIGPSIGPCCFTVGAEVFDAFSAAFPHNSEVTIKDGELLKINLWAANKVALLEAGLLPDHIELSEECTSCKHSWYYSYRADQKETGRMAAVIALHKYA